MRFLNTILFILLNIYLIESANRTESVKSEISENVPESAQEKSDNLEEVIYEEYEYDDSDRENSISGKTDKTKENSTESGEAFPNEVFLTLRNITGDVGTAFRSFTNRNDVVDLQASASDNLNVTTNTTFGDPESAGINLRALRDAGHPPQIIDEIGGVVHLPYKHTKIDTADLSDCALQGEWKPMGVAHGHLHVEGDSAHQTEVLQSVGSYAVPNKIIPYWQQNQLGGAQNLQELAPNHKPAGLYAGGTGGGSYGSGFGYGSSGSLHGGFGGSGGQFQKIKSASMLSPPPVPPIIFGKKPGYWKLPKTKHKFFPGKGRRPGGYSGGGSYGFTSHVNHGIGPGYASGHLNYGSGGGHSGGSVLSGHLSHGGIGYGNGAFSLSGGAGGGSGGLSHVIKGSGGSGGSGYGYGGGYSLSGGSGHMGYGYGGATGGKQVISGSFGGFRGGNKGAFHGSVSSDSVGLGHITHSVGGGSAAGHSSSGVNTDIESGIALVEELSGGGHGSSGSHGSSGGYVSVSSGGHGSSGGFGSSGGYASLGGHGSSGGYASSGLGSSGGYASAGGHGSSGGFGSSGGHGSSGGLGSSGGYASAGGHGSSSGFGSSGGHGSSGGYTSAGGHGSSSGFGSSGGYASVGTHQSLEAHGPSGGFGSSGGSSGYLGGGQITNGHALISASALNSGDPADADGSSLLIVHDSGIANGHLAAFNQGGVSGGDNLVPEAAYLSTDLKKPGGGHYADSSFSSTQIGHGLRGGNSLPDTAFLSSHINQDFAVHGQGVSDDLSSSTFTCGKNHDHNTNYHTATFQVADHDHPSSVDVLQYGGDATVLIQSGDASFNDHILPERKHYKTLSETEGTSSDNRNELPGVAAKLTGSPTEQDIVETEPDPVKINDGDEPERHSYYHEITKVTKIPATSVGSVQYTFSQYETKPQSFSTETETNHEETEVEQPQIIRELENLSNKFQLDLENPQKLFEDPPSQELSYHYPFQDNDHQEPEKVEGVKDDGREGITEFPYQFYQNNAPQYPTFPKKKPPVKYIPRPGKPHFFQKTSVNYLQPKPPVVVVRKPKPKQFIKKKQNYEIHEHSGERRRPINEIFPPHKFPKQFHNPKPNFAVDRPKNGWPQEYKYEHSHGKKIRKFKTKSKVVAPILVRRPVVSPAPVVRVVQVSG